MTESSIAAPVQKNTLEERASDAKFYLTIGSGSFLLTSLVLWLPTVLIPLPMNIISALTIAAICYFFPGLVLLLWGLSKVFRGKDLTFNQVRSAPIQGKDLRKSAKFLLFVSFFAILVILPVLIGQSAFDIMRNTVLFVNTALGPLGLYLGVFIISIFGNFTIVFPIPYIAVLLFVIVSIPNFSLLDGLLLGIVVGIGAAIGEISAWLLGRTQTEALEDSSTGQRILKVKDQVERGYGGVLIFFYAATPLPDDFLLIALGATKYPLWKAIIFCFFGKVVLALLVTIGALNPFLYPLLVEFFTGISDPIMETLYVVIGIIVILLIFLVPWGEYSRRLFGRNRTDRT